MKKYLLIILSIGLFVFASCQKASNEVSKLYGSWRLTKVTNENGDVGTPEDYVFTFSKGNYETDSIGIIGVGIWGESGQDMGTFYYDAAKKQLTLDVFELDGVYEVKKLTHKQLVLYIAEEMVTATFSKL